MTAEIVPIRPSVDSLIEVALATCPSPETRRAYATRLRGFIASSQPLTREGVALYIQAEREAGKGHALVVSILSAVRKLVSEAHVRGLVSDAEYYGIGQLKPGKADRGSRGGNWLTIEQVEQLLALPDRSTYLGLRDAALLSVLIGCGLRREEVATLTWGHLQSRDGRPCLVGFTGKGAKRRTTPLPTWAVRDLEAWKKASMGIERQLITVDRGPALHGRFKYDPDLVFQGISAFHIWRLVDRYGKQMGVDIAPHDLRRTLAQLLRRSGAALEQIQHTLGHSSIATTQIYLGSTLELRQGAAAVDQIALGTESESKGQPE